ADARATPNVSPGATPRPAKPTHDTREAMTTKSANPWAPRARTAIATARTWAASASAIAPTPVVAARPILLPGDVPRSLASEARRGWLPATATKFCSAEPDSHDSRSHTNK